MAARNPHVEGDAEILSETDRVIREIMNRRVLNAVPMPTWASGVRGVPNPLLRSSLFAVVRQGVRPFHADAQIKTCKDAQLRVTGEGLQQSDLDVLMGLFHLARGQPLTSRIQVTERAMLKALGRGGDRGESLGSSDRQWLRRTLARLSLVRLNLKAGAIEFSGALLASHWRDAVQGVTVVQLNPRLILLFGREGWTGVDWAVRCRLRGQPMALWLHAFYSTHAQPFPLKVATLHALCGSESAARPEQLGVLDEWRDRTLKPALVAVQQAVAAGGGRFDWKVLPSGLVAVERTARATSRR